MQGTADANREGPVHVGPCPAGFSDFDRVLKVVRTAFAAHDGRIDPPSSANQATTATLQVMAETGILILASTAESPVVGCVFGTPERDSLYLSKLAVAPAWQGNGIGRRLVSALVDEAHRAGHARVTLGVRLALLENIALFESLGFVRTGVKCHPGYATPTSQDMVLTLQPCGRA